RDGRDPRPGAFLGRQRARGAQLRAGLDLRPRRGGGGEAAPPRADPRRGIRQERAAPAGERDARAMGLRASAVRHRRPAQTHDRPVADLERCRDGEIVTVGGIVSAVKQLTTKKGDPMIFLRLDDLSGSAEAVVFNSVYAASRELCEADRVLILKGRVDHKEGESKLIAIEVSEFEAYVPPSEVRLKVDARKAPAGVLRELGVIVRDHPGEAKVVLALDTSEGPRTLEFGPEYRVAPVPDFY